MRTLSRTVIMGPLVAVLVLAVALCADAVLAPVLAESAPAVQAPELLKPVVVHSARNDTSPSLRSIPPKLPVGGKPIEIPGFPLPKAGQPEEVRRPTGSAGHILQDRPGTAPMPSPLLSFDGLDNDDNASEVGTRIMPPDTQGDVGPSHYVQWVNLVWGVWDKDGNLLYGPAAGNTLWTDFGGPCEYTNDGDPITLYDQAADRWLMSQFALPSYPNGPFYECVAISETGDPLGAWHRYEFLYSNTKMDDYPKFGVWPDAYYMTANQFDPSWAGAGVVAFERAAMLSGTPARMIYFDLEAVNPGFGGILPADWDGSIPPPAGAPGIFVEWDDATWMSDPNDALRLWEFQVDWNNPGNSTFGIGGLPNAIIATADVDPAVCYPSTRDCIPQPDTGQRLDAIDDRLMHRLQYRNFGSHEALVSNHTVDAIEVASGTGVAGLHWFELRDAGSGWTMYQEGVYSPDGDHRWMGSIAMDQRGNLALGYSVSSGSTYPSVRYAGRLASDPLGLLPQAEVELAAGTSYQNGGNRWGDYSMMSVDPVDDCTFWTTQEYVASAPTDWGNWDTRIGSFQFATCLGPSGTLEGVVEKVGTGTPVIGAQISAAANQTFVTYSQPPDGAYGFPSLPTGAYTVTAEAYGYLPQTFTAVDVLSGTTTVQDFSLTAAPMYTVEGTVTDDTTGWPLYARIDIDGYPGDPIWTNPETGDYSIALAGGITYRFHVEAWVPGYLPASRDVGPLVANVIEDWSLHANPETCDAPGYELDRTYYESFEAGDGGFIASGTTSWQWGVPTSGPDAAHSGSNVWATNLAGSYGNGEDGYITSADIDLSSLAGQDIFLSWWQWYQGENCCDYISTEVSNDGGGSWTRVYGEFDGGDVIEDRWERQQVLLAPSYAASNFRLRFHFRSDGSVTYSGWYVDDVDISDVPTLEDACVPRPGGLVVGNIYDDNTLAPLVGAQVANDSGQVTVAMATPLDPALDDAFYTLFSPAGSHIFTATLTSYQLAVQTPTVIQGATIGQSFYLLAGRLSYDPTSLEATVELGASTIQPFTLSNNGSGAAMFEFIELDRGMAPLGPFEEPNFGVKPFKQNLPTAEKVGVPEPPPAAPYAAGDIIQTWPTGLTLAWGLGYDTDTSDLWLGDISIAGGTDLDYRFLPDGTNTGDTIDISWAGVFAADLTYNPHTGMLWQVDVGGDDCIHELDPGSQVPTGNTICPGWGVSQRGLAYDPSTDTYYAGSWNDLMIYHFAADGTMLDAVDVGLAIAGLAYNPDTQHLFAMANAAPNPIYVLDAADNYHILGQFTLAGLSDYGGAGLEMDCDGNLWGVDQQTQINYQFESGETTSMCERDVPWLSEDPVSGTVPSLADVIIDVTFDAAQVDQPGFYYAQLKVDDDTPYELANMPITLTVTTPSTWGKLDGTVIGLGYCDENPAPLEGAEVYVEASDGTTWTRTADENGYYEVWMDEAYSPLIATATYPEHESGQASGITVSGQATTTADLHLRSLEPCVSVEPSSMEATVLRGTSETLPLTLHNDGAALTTFKMTERVGTVWPSSNIVAQDGQLFLVEENKTPASERAAIAPISLAGGGPDPFGYIFADSNEAHGPTFDWIEIAPPAGGSGTAVGLTGVDDGHFWSVTLPFPFNFYGMDYTQLAIASNGTVYFEDAYLGLDNTSIPGVNSYGVVTFIAHFWDDLYVSPGEVYYLAQDDMFIIEYYQVSHCCVTPGSATWQVILFANGDILFQYQDVSFNDSNYDYGASATVGIQDIQFDPAWGLQYSYNMPILSDDLAICFAYPGNTLDCRGADVPWLDEYPDTGTIDADSFFDVDVTFTAFPTMTVGVYTATVVANTDDAFSPGIHIPVTMTVVHAPVCSFETSSPDELEETTTFTNTTNNGYAPTTYRWDFGDSSPISTAEHPTHDYAHVGLYVVVLTATNAWGEDVCTDTVSIEGVEGGFVSNSPVTLGEPVVFANTTLSNPPIVQWFWTFGDGNSSEEENPIHTFAEPGIYTVTLFAANVPYYGPEGVYDIYQDTVEVVPASPYGVRLAPATAEAPGVSAVPVHYTLQVDNTGSVADTFDVSVSGESWATIAPPSVGPLAAGASTNLVVTVTIPAEALFGETDTANVTVASQGEPAVSASATLTTTSNNVYGVIVTPSADRKYGEPGTTVIYALQVTNIGNTVDTLCFGSEGNSWNVHLPTPCITLAATSATEVSVLIDIPSSAAIGDTDTVTVIATSESDPTRSDSAVLTTEALEWVYIYVPIVWRDYGH
jgi:PKD repeat protein